MSSLDEARPALQAITGQDGYPVQHEPTPPVEATFQSFSAGDRSIALMESAGEGQTAIRRHLARRGPGIFSFTLGVADVDAAAGHLREQGARVLLDEPMIMADVRSGNQVFDSLRINFVAPSARTHGLVVELQELRGGSTPDAPVSTTGVTALNEVHCAVQDLDVACRDLAELFGFDVGPLVVQDQPPEQVRFRNLTVHGRPVLAVIAPSAPGTSIEKFLSRRGEGIFSMSLRVRDVDALAATLDESVAQLLMPAPHQVHQTRIGADSIDGARINWVRPNSTPLRSLIELQEYA